MTVAVADRLILRGEGCANSMLIMVLLLRGRTDVRRERFRL